MINYRGKTDYSICLIQWDILYKSACLWRQVPGLLEKHTRPFQAKLSERCII